jgi:hypothetical protein
MSEGFDTASSVLRRALVVGAIAAAVIAVIAAGAGWLAAGGSGLVSGIVGAAFALVFLGITAVSLAVAGRIGDVGGSAFFAALLGGWIVKFVVFLVAMLSLRDQPWVVSGVLFASIVSTVLASLVVDALVVSRARIPVGDR